MYHRNKHPISTVMFSNIHFETTNTEIFNCGIIDEVLNSTQTMKLLLLYKIIYAIKDAPVGPFDIAFQNDITDNFLSSSNH